MIPLIAAGIGAAGNIAGGYLGGKAAEKAARQAAQAQAEAFERNVAILEAIGVPSVEAQKIALENPEYVGDFIAETLGDTALSEISLDPQMRQNQMDMLARLQELSTEGLGVEDRIALDQVLQEATAGDQSRRASILNDMAQRGTVDSGAQLASQLDSNQQANQQAFDNAQNIAAQASRNRMNAMQMLSNQSANMEQTDYGRAAQKATAQDAIQQFNASVRNQAGQQNLANRQNLANQKASTANQQEIYNKGLLQQDYLNRLQKAQSKIGLNTAQGQNQAESALQEGQGKANMWQNIGQGVGNAATAVGNYYNQDPNKIKKP